MALISHVIFKLHCVLISNLFFSLFFSLPCDFKYSTMGKPKATTKIVCINGVHSIVGADGHVIFTKTDSPPNPDRKSPFRVGRKSSLGIAQTTSIPSSGETDNKNNEGKAVNGNVMQHVEWDHVCIIDVDNPQDMSSHEHLYHGGAESQDIPDDLSPMGEDNVFIVTADIEPDPNSCEHHNDLIQSKQRVRGVKSFEICDRKCPHFNRSFSDNTDQKIHNGSLECVTLGEHQCKSESCIDNDTEEPSFIRRLFYNRLLKMVRYKSTGSDEDISPRHISPKEKATRFFLPSNKRSFKRSQSAETGNFLDLPPDYAKSSSDSEAYQMEMVQDSPKKKKSKSKKGVRPKQTACQTLSWDELLSSQRGQSVVIDIPSFNKLKSVDRPRMVRGMSIEKLDSALVRRANSVFYDRKFKRISRKRKTKSMHIEEDRSSGPVSPSEENECGPSAHSHTLMRSTSDPCLTVKHIEEIIVTQERVQNWSRARKSCRPKFLDIQTEAKQHEKQCPQNMHITGRGCGEKTEPCRHNGSLLETESSQTKVNSPCQTGNFNNLKTYLSELDNIFYSDPPLESLDISPSPTSCLRSPISDASNSVCLPCSVQCVSNSAGSPVNQADDKRLLANSEPGNVRGVGTSDLLDHSHSLENLALVEDMYGSHYDNLDNLDLGFCNLLDNNN